MSKKHISQEKIIQSFISNAFLKSAGATSLSDISSSLEIKKASLYNHFDNRDSMYEATIQHCKDQTELITLLDEKLKNSIINKKITLFTAFKRIITRLFEIYENEPFFEIYVFLHTEQFFNQNAMKSVQNELNSLQNIFYKILLLFVENKMLQNHTEKELKDISEGISAIVIQQRDLYLAKRKEIIRQNPESGAGSLFALPTDEHALNRTIKIIESYLKLL